MRNSSLISVLTSDLSTPKVIIRSLKSYFYKMRINFEKHSKRSVFIERAFFSRSFPFLNYLSKNGIIFVAKFTKRNFLFEKWLSVSIIFLKSFCHWVPFNVSDTIKATVSSDFFPGLEFHV